MFDVLEPYKSTDHFFLAENTTLEKVCNAPKNGVGVYLVYQLKNGRIELVYVGNSGKVSQTGKVRKDIGGLFNEIVKGQQFGGERQKTWKQKIKDENIEAFDIYWYETVDKTNFDIPTYVQGLVLQSYLHMYGTLPKWNSEF